MIKVKGKDYPASFFKLVLADPIADKLEFIRQYLALPNNIEAFTIAINVTHKLLIDKIKLEEAKHDDIILGASDGSI